MELKFLCSFSKSRIRTQEAVERALSIAQALDHSEGDSV